MPKPKTQCDFDCLHCALPDCQRATIDVAKQPRARRRKHEQLKQDSWDYAYMATTPKPDYTVGLITRTMDKAELEAMLAAQYGRKLEPVTGSKRRQASRAKK